MQLTLYYREGCHLCETMLQALRSLQADSAFEIILVDIDRDPALRQRYDEWVPVLSRGEQEICHYTLDFDALTAVISSE
ncbi:hypothetical protein MNBD_GAMMA13-1301 [hydrothermal vent metagenome]|uniref:Uncharacterized protein n=1 Tax=hydrothermal vent metagenome TaxID=652676 RepID=A0A3B0YDE3_9ZZZZ